jgi:hypothetical protein
VRATSWRQRAGNMRAAPRGDMRATCGQQRAVTLESPREAAFGWNSCTRFRLRTRSFRNPFRARRVRTWFAGITATRTVDLGAATPWRSTQSYNHNTSYCKALQRVLALLRHHHQGITPGRSQTWTSPCQRCSRSRTAFPWKSIPHRARVERTLRRIGHNKQPPNAARTPGEQHQSSQP